MKDLDVLKKLVIAHRQGKAKIFPEDLKKKILMVAEEYGKTSTMKAIQLSPSSFYKWLKESKVPQLEKKSGKSAKNVVSQVFVEIPHQTKSPMNHDIVASKDDTHVKWEAIRVDGSILRCELRGSDLKVASILNSFLNEEVLS